MSVYFPQEDAPYRYDRDFVERINGIQSSWEATVYPEYEKMTLGDHLKRAGGKV